MKQVKFIEKCLSILLVTIILIINFGTNYVYAVEFNDPTKDPNYWKPTVGSDDTLVDKTSSLLGAINTIGIIVSMIALIAIGIKYMLGSVEEKAEYKKTMIPYIIGFVLLMTCTTIANLIYEISAEVWK